MQKESEMTAPGLPHLLVGYALPGGRMESVHKTDKKLGKSGKEKKRSFRHTVPLTINDCLCEYIVPLCRVCYKYQCINIKQQ